MTKDKLVVDYDSNRDAYRLTWWLAEDGDMGGSLGDPQVSQAYLNAATGYDREVAVACHAGRATDGCKHDRDGYYWPTRAAATAALRAIKLAIKTDGGAPWPAWAKQAVAAGWKAPKGWKP